MGWFDKCLIDCFRDRRDEWPCVSTMFFHHCHILVDVNMCQQIICKLDVPNKKPKMKKLTIIIILILVAGIIHCQERFPIKQLTFDFAQQGFPSWSPDGEYLAFAQTDRQDTIGENGL